PRLPRRAGPPGRPRRRAGLAGAARARADLAGRGRGRAGVGLREAGAARGGTRGVAGEAARTGAAPRGGARGAVGAAPRTGGAARARPRGVVGEAPPAGGGRAAAGAARAGARGGAREAPRRGGRAATRWRGARCGGEGRRAGDGGQDAGAPPAPRGGAGAVPGAPAGRAAGGRRARESDEQQPLPADLRARVERLERASASPSSLERLPAGAEASSPRPLALGRVERMERELAALARELAALAQRAPWRNGTAPDDSPAIASASEQRLADRLERELASAAERARASEEAEVRSLAGRVAGMAESVVRQGRNQRGWPVHMARPAARARLPGSAPQGGRSGSSERWRSTVARAQAGANLDLSSIERAQQRELCFRKCKAAKGMAFRTRALVAETLLQMAQATAGSDHQAARDRCAKAAAASRKRHDRRHELLEKVQQTCRRSLGAGHSVERGRSPSPCSLHSEPLLRGDTSSDESAIREAGALVGASNVGLMWNFGRAAPQSDSDSDGSSYFPRYQGGRGAAAARGGGGPTSVDALLEDAQGRARGRRGARCEVWLVRGVLCGGRDHTGDLGQVSRGEPPAPGPAGGRLDGPPDAGY
ncbi:unnamed protein product, partial [Prorocentrum cordatum]